MIESVLRISIEDITIGFLESYFSEEKEESDVLEFKSYFENNQTNHKFKEDMILKTICAFLNSSGGVIIWGAPVGKKKDGRTVFMGNLSPVEYLYEKDGFISKVSNRTIPLPANIRFHKIEASTEKYVYVIEVQESITKPHQFDNRYFMRLDGQTKNAPHHYIEALFKQMKFPQIEGYIKINSYKKTADSSDYKPIDTSQYILHISVLIFNVSPLQNEENISYRLLSRLGEFPRTDVRVSHSNNYHEAKEINASPVLSFGHHFEASYSIYFREIIIKKNDYQVSLELSFGGKFAPHKFSNYILDFSKNIGNNFNDLFIEISENKNGYDMQLELGATHESFLKDYLGQ